MRGAHADFENGSLGDFPAESAGEAMGFALAREGEKPTICFGRVCSAEPRLDGVSHSEILRGGIEFDNRLPMANCWRAAVWLAIAAVAAAIWIGVSFVFVSHPIGFLSTSL